jgi:hypothetical protein
MRPWAHWTARTAVVAVGLAAASGGLSGVALAGTDGGNGSGTVSVLSGNGLLAPLSLPVDICGNAAALLGIANAGCQIGAASIVTLPAAGDSTGSGASGGASVGSGNQVHAPVTVPVDVCGNAVAVLGASAAGCVGGASSSGTNANGANAGGPGGGGGRAAPRGGATAWPGFSRDSAGPLAGLRPVSGLTSLSGVTGDGIQSAQGSGAQAFGDTLNAPGSGAGTTDSPAVSQLVGLGALPGLADLVSSAGLANLPAPGGATGGSMLMPGSALSAADASGMSSDSFAALAIGALLAGAAALKIASRRARDRKAGIGATI